MAPEGREVSVVRGKSRTTRWLLETGNLSVRYWTMLHLLDLEESHTDVEQARRLIPSSPLIRKIMAKQKLEGFWGEPDSPYYPKYKSSYWTLMLLGFLGLDRSEEKITSACEFIFSFQHKEGGFSAYTETQAKREYEFLRAKGRSLGPLSEWSAELIREQQLSCLTGNVCAALIRLGYGSDRRIRKALRWLADVQNKDGGWLCPYWSAHANDTHGCFAGTICALEAFSETPRRSWPPHVRNSAQRGSEFMLTHRLYRADHHGHRIIDRRWLTLAFPWFSNYNILRGLDVLTRLGHGADSRLNDAFDVLTRKRLADGTWALESTPSGRMQANLESKSRPSKWVTLIAMRSLKRRAEARR